MRSFFKIGYILVLIFISKLALTCEFDQFEQAIKQYESQLPFANDSETANIFNNLGDCYRLKNAHGQALDYYDSALTTDPSHGDALYWSCKLRLESDERLSKDKAIITERLKTALSKYPKDTRFQSLMAEFEMLKRGPCAASGVRYFPDFLTQSELESLQAIFSRASWLKVKKGNSSGITFAGDDKEKLAALLGPISERLKAYDLLPSGKTQFGYTVIRYPTGGSLNQHKDHKERVDHFVLGINIGGPCDLDFVLDRGQERTSLPLASKSVFIMENEAHEKCSHGISNVQAERYSLLFYVPTQDDASEIFDIEKKQFAHPKNENTCHCCCEHHRLLRLLILLEILGQFNMSANQ